MHKISFQLKVKLQITIVIFNPRKSIVLSPIQNRDFWLQKRSLIAFIVICYWLCDGKEAVVWNASLIWIGSFHFISFHFIYKSGLSSVETAFGLTLQQEDFHTSCNVCLLRKSYCIQWGSFLDKHKQDCSVVTAHSMHTFWEIGPILFPRSAFAGKMAYLYDASLCMLIPRPVSLTSI